MTVMLSVGQGYLDILRNEAAGEDGTGFGRGWLFLWTEGGFSEEMIKLEEDLGVGPGVGYPNLVVVNGKREKYAPFRGSFLQSWSQRVLKRNRLYRERINTSVSTPFNRSFAEGCQ